MPPLPPVAERTLQAVGARRRVPGTPTRSEFVGRLRQIGGEGEGLVAVFDARSIAGERHLYSAWAHLGRSRARGEARLRDRAAELALFVAGDDQLPRALQKVGVQEDTEEMVVVAERPRDLKATVAAFGLEEAEGVFPRPPSEETLRRLGILEVDRRAVPEATWEGLVLERVALLELEGAHATKGPPTTKS